MLLSPNEQPKTKHDRQKKIKEGGEKMSKCMELNALIHGQFRSQAAFADHIHWHRQRLNKIVNGEKQPSLKDVQDIADGLGVPFMMVANFCLTSKSPIEQL